MGPIDLFLDADSACDPEYQRVYRVLLLKPVGQCERANKQTQEVERAEVAVT